MNLLRQRQKHTAASCTVALNQSLQLFVAGVAPRGPEMFRLTEVPGQPEFYPGCYRRFISHSKGKDLDASHVEPLYLIAANHIRCPSVPRQARIPENRKQCRTHYVAIRSCPEHPVCPSSHVNLDGLHPIRPSVSARAYCNNGMRDIDVIEDPRRTQSTPTRDRLSNPRSSARTL